MELKLGELRQHLRDQLDAMAPVPVKARPFAADDDLAVLTRGPMERREDLANALVSAASLTLELSGYAEFATSLRFYPGVGRAEWWLSTAPTPAETEVPA